MALYLEGKITVLVFLGVEWVMFVTGVVRSSVARWGG